MSKRAVTALGVAETATAAVAGGIALYSYLNANLLSAEAEACATSDEPGLPVRAHSSARQLPGFADNRSGTGVARTPGADR
jgi:hypothetical protein